MNLTPDQQAIEKFKTRIERENKNNPYKQKRRRFSKKLKKDIANFIITSPLSTIAIAAQLTISSSILEGWKRYITPSPSAFKEISITGARPIRKKMIKATVERQAIKTNQIVLILLLIVQIIERLLDHLIS